MSIMHSMIAKNIIDAVVYMSFWIKSKNEFALVLSYMFRLRIFNLVRKRHLCYTIFMLKTLFILNVNLKLADSFPFEIIADEKRELIKLLGMEDLDERDSGGIPLAARAVRNWRFFIF